MTPADPQAFDLNHFVIHHLMNNSTWHPSFLPEISLPKPLTVHSLMLLFCAGLLVLFIKIFYKQEQKVPTGATNALEAMVLFIRDDIAIANLGEEDGRKFTPLLCTYFFFILLMNLIGAIPFFASPTANINVTFALAIISLGFMTVGAIARNGWKGFFSAFVISGLDWPVQWFVFIFEIIGLFIKTTALTIRLFANMLAGHMVIFIFLGLVALFGIMALPAVVLAILISLLEIFVAFLQAYIFTMLSAVFMGQIYHPAH
jgi:F-type H+-transporting ATPase subunit a